MMKKLFGLDRQGGFTPLWHTEQVLNTVIIMISVNDKFWNPCYKHSSWCWTFCKKECQWWDHLTPYLEALNFLLLPWAKGLSVKQLSGLYLRDTLAILNTPQMPWGNYAMLTLGLSGSCRHRLSQGCWKQFVADIGLLRAVVVNPTCQFDIKNQLGDVPLDMPVEALFWLVLLRWEEPCSMGGTIPWAEGKMNISVHHFLLSDCGCSMTSCLDFLLPGSSNHELKQIHLP